MTSLRGMCAAAALTVLVIGPTQGFAALTDHEAKAANSSTSTMSLPKYAEGPEESIIFEYGGLMVQPGGQDFGGGGGGGDDDYFDGWWEW
jgi:hypothetical protein